MKKTLTIAPSTTATIVDIEVPDQYIKETITVVPPAVNQRPVARAGADQTITLPVNTINLDGSTSSDPDGRIVTYGWRQTSGPTATIEGGNTALAVIKNLKEGVSVFELRVTDDKGGFSADTVSITVKPEEVNPPLPGATFPFTLTKNTAWKKRNFAGYENWNGQNYASFPATWSDYYFRFTITDFRKGTSTALNTARFDQEIRKAINNRAKFSFGLMVVCDSDDFLSSETYGGAKSRYPISWHNQMQAESVKDFTRNGMWIPNWNSPSLLKNIDDLNLEIANYINTASYNGVRYKDVINYSEIRLYGQWGEWHNGGLFDNVSQFPAGTRPTEATYRRLIDSNTKAYPDWPLVVLFAAFDANWLPHTMTPPSVTDYVLKARNNWGLIGWRRDQWGNDDNYVHDYLERNTRSYNGTVFNTVIMERWKYAPVVGEPYGPGADLSKLEAQVIFYRATSVGNGNYPNNATSQALFKKAEDKAGYKLAFISGELKTTSLFDFDISIVVENFGICPCYEDYTLIYELKNSAGQIVWTNASAWKPALKLPGTHVISDKFKVTTLTNGTYSLSAVFKSVNDYRRMPLFNNEQKSDGSILLTDKFTVATT